jgi:uncharacterized protein (TIGR03083 family)
VKKRVGEELQGELRAEREALLAVVSRVEERTLAWPTRNPGWAVRDVIAHVLASDADLISLVEAAGRSGTDAVGLRGQEAHEQEMARWAEASPEALAAELRERGERWRGPLAALPDSAFAIPVQVWWQADPKALRDAVGDWRGHDTQHGEDVRLALEGGLGRQAGLGADAGVRRGGQPATATSWLCGRAGCVARSVLRLPAQLEQPHRVFKAPQRRLAQVCKQELLARRQFSHDDGDENLSRLGMGAYAGR